MCCVPRALTQQRQHAPKWSKIAQRQLTINHVCCVTQVDAPRWGKENMVIDNLDDIGPCRVDCDKDGGSTGEDFGFFGNMLALNVSTHFTCIRLPQRA